MLSINLGLHKKLLKVSTRNDGIMLNNSVCNSTAAPERQIAQMVRWLPRITCDHDLKKEEEINRNKNK